MLLWELEWGMHVKDLELIEAKGKSVKALEERPIIKDGLEFYIQAYVELIYDRQAGMTVGYIPWHIIKTYAEHHGITCPNEFDKFLRYIRALENTQRKFDEKKVTTNGF